MTLTEFLLARIAEDEAVARDSLALYGPGSSLYIASHNPARVLTECAAKRQIVEGMRATADIEGGGYENAVSEALRYLAAVYASHPDYRAEWAL